MLDNTTLGYILLPLNSLLFSGLFIVNKEYGKRMKGTLLNSLVFAFFAGLANTVCFLIASLIQGWSFNPLTLAFGAGIAFCFALLQVSGVLAASLGNMSFYSQSFMLGSMVLPFLYGVLFNGDSSNWLKVLAIVLMAVSLGVPLIDEFKKKDEGQKDPKKTILFYVLCLIAFLANGSICVLVAMQGTYAPESTPFVNTFVFSAFIVLFAILGLSILYPLSKNEEAKKGLKKSFTLLPVLLAMGYGLFNAWGTYVGMEGIARIDASLFFPVASGICISVTFLVCRFIYKEKAGIYSILGFFLTLAAVGMFIGSTFLK